MPAPPASPLIEEYQRNGCVLARGLFSAGEVTRLRDHYMALRAAGSSASNKRRARRRGRRALGVGEGSGLMGASDKPWGREAVRPVQTEGKGLPSERHLA